MIARPKISQHEWKTAEIGGVGHVALVSRPGERRERQTPLLDVRGLVAEEICERRHEALVVGAVGDDVGRVADQ